MESYLEKSEKRGAVKKEIDFLLTLLSIDILFVLKLEIPEC